MSARVLLTVSAALALAACAAPKEITPVETSAGAPEETRAEPLAALMTDIFETAPDDPDNDIRDQRVRINAPALDGVWLYYQLNTGPERKLYRQRVINLSPAASDGDDGRTVLQHTYILKEPERYVDAWSDPDLLAAMTPEQIEPFFEQGCEQVWRPDDTGGWRGYVDPKTCRIFSERRQSYISIEAEARLDETAYRQTERGYDRDGNMLFGTAPGAFIVLYRQ